MILKHENYCISRRALLRALWLAPLVVWAIFLWGCRAEDETWRYQGRHFGWESVVRDIDDGWLIAQQRGFRELSR